MGPRRQVKRAVVDRVWQRRKQARAAADPLVAGAVAGVVAGLVAGPGDAVAVGVVVGDVDAADAADVVGAPLDDEVLPELLHEARSVRATPTTVVRTSFTSNLPFGG